MAVLVLGWNSISPNKEVVLLVVIIIKLNKFVFFLLVFLVTVPAIPDAPRSNSSVVATLPLFLYKQEV